MTKIHSIDQVNFDSRNPGGGRFRIMADGQVNSGGWSNPRLEKMRHKDENGFAVYNFVADPPSPGTIVTHAFVNVQAEAVTDVGETGAAIESETNKMSIGFAPEAE